MKLLDKFEDFILTEREADYIARGFILLIFTYIINLVIFNNSLIGSWIVIGLIELYGLYVCLSVMVIIYSSYKKKL